MREPLDPDQSAAAGPPAELVCAPAPVPLPKFLVPMGGLPSGRLPCRAHRPRSLVVRIRGGCRAAAPRSGATVAERMRRSRSSMAQGRTGLGGYMTLSPQPRGPSGSWAGPVMGAWGGALGVASQSVSIPGAMCPYGLVELVASLCSRLRSVSCSPFLGNAPFGRLTRHAQQFCARRLESKSSRFGLHLWVSGLCAYAQD